MNRIARLIFSFLALAATACAQPLPDQVLFHNGDSLYGKLLAIDSSGTLRWQHPDAAEPIDFKLGSVAQLDFAPPKTLGVHSNSTCHLLLAGGDFLEGSFVSADQSAVTLQTWFAGPLRVPRSVLRSLVFVPVSPSIFAGITGMEGWTQGKSVAAFAGESGQWTYRDGAFYASKAASIARDLKLPGVAEIHFDVAWKGPLNLAIALYTDSLQPILLTGKEAGPDFGGFYSFRFQNTVFIDMMPIKKREPLRSLGQLIIPSLNNRSRLHVDLRVSKPQRKIALFFDDELVKEWDDTAGFAGEGTGMRFVQNPGGVVKLSNLRISRWNGVFEQTLQESADLAQDIFWLEDGTKLTGTLESMANGQLAARATNGPIEIPLAKLQAIDFAHGTNSAPRTQTATVRATFAHGGGLTFDLESWRPDEMTVRSPDFGEAKINPAAFSRLQFLPPEKKTGGPKG
ncbi:MAG TPA: hypothetical protein VFC44_21830 [Candidatus Saccharimonadales bacterium]|nr:hypothetical protein [Candidatus Saccharimonadales bacterium]